METAMAQLAIYLDEETAKALDAAALRDGTSRSDWVRRAIRDRLEQRLPESFFSVIGAWEDDRSPAEILADLRIDGPARPRPALD